MDTTFKVLLPQGSAESLLQDLQHKDVLFCHTHFTGSHYPTRLLKKARPIALLD